MRVSLSRFLIGRGWLPAPNTSYDEGAWQHPRLSIVPRELTRDAGTYGDGEARFCTTAACAVQCVHDGHQERKQERLRAMLRQYGQGGL